MSLNLFDILQEVICEDVSPNDVNDAINNQHRVIIKYSDEKDRAPETRMIEPYVYGITKAGNAAIRAYQYYGDTFRGAPKWKLFRLDRITGWKETDEFFNITPRENGYNAEEYNREGDKSLTTIFNQVGLEPVDTSDTLAMARKKTERIKKSKPTNVLKQGTKSGPVNNDNMQDMIKRNMEISKHDDDFYDKLDFNAQHRGPVVPKDGETLAQARDRRKKERDKRYGQERTARNQMDMPDRRAIRTPKKYRDNDDEPLNDVEF